MAKSSWGSQLAAQKPTGIEIRDGLWPEEIFLTRREKIEKFRIFRGNFVNPDPNQRWLTQPNPNNKKLTRPGSKNFDPGPSLQEIEIVLIKSWSIYIKVTVCTYVPFSHLNRWTNLHQILHRPPCQLGKGS